MISDERVAVVELVKNAYDADASEVNVIFEMNERLQFDRIRINDDGHGMDMDTVVEGWFEPGTVLKKKTQRSPGNRLYQGAKGVGRFAAARLGEALILETTTNGSSSLVTVLLEWGAFDDDSYLDEVSITYDVSTGDEMHHGTMLTIEGVDKKKHWNEGNFQDLHDRLSRLISPFDEIGGFKIQLDIPSFPHFTGVVEPHALTRSPKYQLSGSLSLEGNVTATLKVDNKVHKQYEAHPIGGKDARVACGAFAFDIRAWDRDRTGLSPHMVQFDISITEVRRILNSYCGVSIYRDGFRVHPYGEQGDDWLGLDNRSRQNPTKHLAKNQVIASIRTSREINPEVVDRTTREGLVHNFAYRQLIDWVTRVLSLLEEDRYRIRPRDDTKPEYTTTLYEAFDMSNVIEQSRIQLGKAHPVTTLVVEKDREIRVGVRKLQEHYSRVLLAAGLGQLVDLVIHEIGAPIGRINREMLFLQKLLRKYAFTKDDKDAIAKSIKSILGWSEQVSNLRARLDPKTAGKRGRATSFNVAEEIDGNINLFQNLLEKQKVKVLVSQPKTPVIVHMARSSVGQILANLLDNSVYWLTRHHGDGGGGTINIDLKSIKGGFQLRYSDDGPGIPEHDMDRIFEQYFTSKPNGMGLGLYIARQIIEPYGKLVLLDDCLLPGACFEASFVRRVGL